MEIKSILLYPNLEKADGLLCTRRVAKLLRELGAVPMLDEGFRETIGGDCVYGRFSALLPRCDIIMPIGGDGTIMRAARHAAARGKPLLGVNAGRVGFLTQVELHELDKLRLLFEGGYTVSRRMMLEAELAVGGKKRRYSGLNDIVISRGSGGHIADIHVHRADMLIARQRADGLIFATPTGSTAYSLSAGGPVVEPTLTILIMTAICPHSTGGRSMALSAEDCEYSVTDHSTGDTDGLTVSVDGRRVGRISGGQELLVRKSRLRVPFIDLGLCGFYENVGRKLSWS